MERIAFLVVTDWPSDELSRVGRLTQMWTREADDHIGIFIPFCTDREVAAHSAPLVSDGTADGEENVSFDYLANLMPRFQAITNKAYFTARSQCRFYPILHADAADVHDVCLDVAEAAPRNYCCHRLNAVFWCWPLHCCCCPTQGVVSQSTCVALSARIIAAAVTGNLDALTNDAFVFDTLGLERFGMAAPFAPFFLNGFTPRGIADALLRTGAIGPPVDSVADALALCEKFPATSVVRKALNYRPLPLMPFSRGSL